MPKSVLQAIQYPEEKKAGAELLALGAIVVLLYVFRGQALNSATIASFAAIGLAAVVNYVSKALSPKLSKNVLISGYATVAVTLFLTINVQDFVEWTYADLAIRLNPYTFDRAVLIIPVLLAAVPTVAFWLLKARFVDGNRITLDAVAYASTVALLGALAILAVTFLGDTLFDRLIKMATG